MLSGLQKHIFRYHIVMTGIVFSALALLHFLILEELEGGLVFFSTAAYILTTFPVVDINYFNKLGA